MAIRNDNAINQLAGTICSCVRHEVPDAITAKLEEITKAAEAKAAANFPHEDTGGWGPARSAYDDIRSVEWVLIRLLDEFPHAPLYDPRCTIDPKTMKDLRYARNALDSACTLIATVSRREGSEGGDVQ